VQELIRRRNLIPEKTCPFRTWPWPLKVFTLGRFAILRDGEPLQFTRKVQQKPLSLLKALIALGGKEVREERIADLLWPESDGDIKQLICFLPGRGRHLLCFRNVPFAYLRLAIYSDWLRGNLFLSGNI
jgi:hypothetical protein